MRPFHKTISSPKAPTSSGCYTPEEDHNQLNFSRLFAALLRLKRNSVDIKIEKSLDGLSEVYLIEPKNLPSVPVSPSVHPSPSSGVPLSVDSLIQRLKIIAENEKETSTPTTPPYNLQVSLDNCTLFYIPAENIEKNEHEFLPNSVDGEKPSELYYNLKSESTLKFIQRALKRKSDSPSRADQEMLDKPIIILQQKGSISKTSIDSPVTGDISRPDLAEILKKKLEELRIEGEVKQAMDDENVQIITLNYSPCSNSGSMSSKENSTPVLSRSDYPNLLSPKTNSKLIRKLHAVQEDFEGEDEDLDSSRKFLEVGFSLPVFQLSPRYGNGERQKNRDRMVQGKKRSSSY